MLNNYEKTCTIKTGNEGAVNLLIFILVAGLLSVSGCKKDKNNGGGNGSGTPNLQLVAENFVSPLGVIEAPDDSKRLFIIDQTGTIWIVKQDGSKLSTPFINISSKMVSLTPEYDERGLLGLAFHPNFKNNHKFYLFYSALPHAGGPEPGESWNNLTRVSEFMVSSSNPDMADPSYEKVILEVDDPQMNHNGGTLAFGPDGYLYISIGDGGAADDNAPGHVEDWYTVNAGGNAQNIDSNLMGKILRIDVNSGNPYAIPNDNPFVNTAGKDEIYAYGFRNPYRFSFDMSGNRALYVGDAGQKLYEEINVVSKGGNYGWNVREGTICFNTDSNLLIRPSCPTVDLLGITLTDPVVELKNTAHPDGDGIATVIVGGNVYRGNSIPGWQGKYIFGTFSRTPMTADGELYMSTPGQWDYEKISLKDYPSNLGQYIRGFGQDLSGEMYVTTTGGAGVSGTSGKVYKFVNSK
jgi:glucose/arabinose dehydrogenase